MLSRKQEIAKRWPLSCVVHFSIGVLSLISISGCTSVQWRGNDGRDHHLGLFVYQVTKHPEGTELRTTSVGIDLRLSGENRGVSIGLGTITETKPEIVVVRTPEDLAHQALRRMTRADLSTASIKRGFCYLSEDVSRQATMLDSSVFGIDASSAASNRSFSIGYNHSFNYVGDSLGQDVAQVYTYQPNSSDRVSLTLITTHSLAK